MKLFMFAIIAVMLIGTTAIAAEVPTSKGDKAMMFSFHGFDDMHLHGYDSLYGIGLRYYIADGTAIRAGLEFGNWSRTETANDPDNYEDEEESWSFYGASVVYEKHLEAPCSSISPYYGVGATFQIVSAECTDEYGQTDTESGTGFGGFGVLGFEWAFTNCMTFGGEYKVGFWTASGDTDVDAPGRDTRDEWDESYMGFDTASVFLSVYF